MVPRAPAFALAFALGACDRGEAPDEIVAVERTGEAVGAKTNLAHVAAVLGTAASLEDVPPAELPAEAIALVLARLDGFATLFRCTPQIESDGVSRIDAVFTDCSSSFLSVEGEAHATLAVELDADGAAVLVWTVTESGLRIGKRFGTPPELSGTGTLRVPVAAGQPMQWTTAPGFVVDNVLGTFEVDAQASWSVADGCVDMDFEAAVRRRGDAADEDDLERRIGTISIAGTGIHRCRDSCPDAGTVTIAFGSGALLEWSYGADETVEVIGPRGRHFLARPPCADE